MPNRRFPDEYRDTLERFIKQRAEEATFMGLASASDMESLLKRIREPDFGLCVVCGAVLSLARVMQNFALTRCQECTGKP